MRMPSTIGEGAIWAVVIAAIVALVYVAFVQMGVVIPAWVVTVFWILVVAVVIIMAIKFLMGIGNKE